MDCVRYTCYPVTSEYDIPRFVSTHYVIVDFKMLFEDDTIERKG